MSEPSELSYTFCEVIVRGRGLAFDCRSCGEVYKWTDTTLADRFLFNLDRPLSDLQGKVKCPACGDQNMVIYTYQAGTMNWRSRGTAKSDMLAIIEDHKLELREMVRVKIASPDQPSKHWR